MRQPPATSRSSKPRAREPRSPRYSAASSVSSSTTWPVGSPRTPASWAAGTGSSTTMSTASIAARCSCGIASSGTDSYRESGGCCGSVSLIVRPLIRCGGVVVVGHGDLPLLGPGPPYGELAERAGLVEGDRALPEELEQGEEAGDDDGEVLGVRRQRPEGRGADPPQPVDQERGLLPHGDHRGVEVGEVHLRGPGPGGEGRGGDLREPFGGDSHDELGQQRREV